MQSLQNDLRAVTHTLNTGSIGTALENLKISLNDLPKQFAKESNTGQMKSTLNDVANRLRTLAGDKGYDLTKIVGKALDESATLKDVRKKTDSVQGTTEVMQRILEKEFGGEDAPFAIVVLK